MLVKFGVTNTEGVEHIIPIEGSKMLQFANQLEARKTKWRLCGVE